MPEATKPLACVICGRDGELTAATPRTALCEEHARLATDDAMAVDAEDRADLLAHLSCLAADDLEEDGP